MAKCWYVLGTALMVGCGETPLGLQALTPGAVCIAADEAHTITLAGQGFMVATLGAGGDEPTVMEPAVSLRWEAALPGTDDPALPDVDLPAEAVSWRGSNTLELTLDPASAVAPGAWTVWVHNPDGRSVAAADPLVITGSPRIDRLDPDGVCTESEATPLTITGRGFVRTEAAAPIVLLEGSELPVTGLDDCETVGTVDICGAVEVEVGGGIALDLLDLRVVNPEPGACSVELVDVVEGLRPPTIDAVSPGSVCRDGGLVDISGEGFEEGLRAWVGGVEVDEVSVLGSDLASLRLGSDTPTGLQDLEITLPSGCGSTMAEAVTVRSSADLFFLDPPALPEGIGLRATLYVADPGSSPSAVWLSHSSGEERELEFEWSEELPGTIQVVLPDDLAAGSWDASLDTEDGCGGSMEAALQVQTSLGLVLDEVDPATAWIWDHSAVSLLGSGFEDLPRVYLGGTQAGGPLHAVRYDSSDLLQAVVAPGFEPGTYDVIVVNPDGAVGLLEEGLTITEEAAPRIESVSPINLSASSDEVISIQGRDFREPTVTLSCREDGAEREVAAEVQSTSYALIEALAPSSDFNDAVCVINAFNDDGTRGRYASVSVRNPSDNLSDWQVGPELNVARRAPVAASGRTTSVTRHAWVLGGDEGDEATAMATLERADIGVYGDLDDWVLLDRTLPEPRSLAVAATVGRFVYMVGGHDGSGPVATTWRALILDPLDVPAYAGLSMESMDEGLDAGRWYYRISALYDETYQLNPDGESLASDPITVVVSESLAPAGVELSWTAVDGAVGYRVYRSPSADGGSAALGWVADVEETVFTDLGDPADDSFGPLSQGDLGAWATLAELDTARSAPCMTAVADPAPDPERVHLFVAGGLDTEGDPLDSIERLSITINSPLSQSTGSWEVLDEELSEARWACGAFMADKDRHTIVGDEAWVWFAGGIDDKRAVGDVDAGRIEEGGELVEWQTVDSMAPGRAGFGLASASDQLYAFGGKRAEPSEDGTSASLDETPPDLVNWNSLGTSMSEARFLPGTTSESGLILVVGGETTTETATSSVDWTPL